MLKFASNTQNMLVQYGKEIDEKNRAWFRQSLGVSNAKVEPKKHAICSGPPGVGKSYGAIDELNKAGVNFIQIEPGTSDAYIAVMLATAVYMKKAGQELVVLFDDADDVILRNVESLNTYKKAMAKFDPNLGIIPTWSHNVDMSGMIKKLETQGRTTEVEAIKSCIHTGSIGITIPTNEVRFLILCNSDLEDPKTFSRRGNFFTHVSAWVDRCKYRRINIDWEKNWGWLAYVLGDSQPFPNYSLEDEQKKELLNWLYSNWNNMRRTPSYRTVEQLAADMINEPDSYVDCWMDNLKGN